MPEKLTADEIRRQFMELVRESCMWDIPTDNTAQDVEELTRTLFYISGACDMAHEMIKKLEGENANRN